MIWFENIVVEMKEDKHVIWLEFLRSCSLNSLLNLFFIFPFKYDIGFLLPQYGRSRVSYFHFIPVPDEEGPQSCCHNSLVWNPCWSSLYDKWTKSNIQTRSIDHQVALIHFYKHYRCIICRLWYFLIK